MKYVKDALKKSIPYYSKKYDDGILLNANESPFQLNNKFKRKFIKSFKKLNLNRYPDMDYKILKEKFSKYYKLSSLNFTFGSGSDELLDCIFKSILNKGDKVLTFIPTFSMYDEYTKIHEGSFVGFNLNDDFNLDVKSFIDCIKKENPKITILCTPNNPTGFKIDYASILKIITSTKNVVVIDEAYLDFEEETYANLVLKYDNVIILKTFSKLYKSAGIRFGYAIAGEDLINTINLTKSPYNLNSLTSLYASIIIDNMDMVKDDLIYLKQERERIYNILIKNNIKVFPSKTNFLFMKVDSKTVQKLKDNKIYVRYINYKDEIYERVTVGKREENDKFLEVVLNG